MRPLAPARTGDAGGWFGNAVVSRGVSGRARSTRHRDVCAITALAPSSGLGLFWAVLGGAPIFAEVADSFMRFMGDGIFVAHNVNFDHGFISHEYERLDRRFRFPKLCTVAGMRRRYPGHKSYGLGKLCEFYGIELETHHRALCDARATGHLLNLINQKREAALPSALEDAA